MGARRRLVEQTLLLSFAQLSALGVGFVATVLIARALGPEGRGVFAWIMTLVGLAVQVAALASTQTVRAVAPEIGGDRAFVPTLVALGLTGTVVGLPLLGYAVAQRPAGLDGGLVLAAWSMVPLTAAAVAVIGLVQMRERPWPILLAHLGPKLFLVLAAAALWQAGALDLAGALWLNVAVAALQLALLLALLRHDGLGLRPSLALARRVARLLGAGWLAALALYAMPRASLVMLGSLGLLAEAGHYSVALTLYEIMIVLPVAASGVLTTHLARDGAARAGRRTALALIGFMAALALLAGLAAPLLVPLLFGEAFRPAVVPFQALLGAVLLATLQQYWHGILVARGSAASVALPSLVGLAVAVAVGWIAVPALATAGAVAATLIGSAAGGAVAGALALSAATGR